MVSLSDGVPRCKHLLYTSRKRAVSCLTHYLSRIGADLSVGGLSREHVLLAILSHSGKGRDFLMHSPKQDLFGSFLSPHNRREFLKRAGAVSLSGTALAAFLEACGSSSGGTSTTPGINMAGPIDLQTLTTHAKQEGQLQAIGIPP